MVCLRETATCLFVFALILISSSIVRSTEPVNVYFPEKMMLKFNNKPYVRVYQTVFAEAPDVSTTAYPSGTYKDIFKDKDGNIIIYPDKNIITNKLFVGIGDYRNQLKFIGTYSKQGAANPLIKSFIVPYDIVYDILQDVQKEEPGCSKTASLNVDIKYSNQFGLIRKHADLLRLNALPDSLVTFAKVQIENAGAHLGLVEVVDAATLRERWNDKNIPDHPPNVGTNVMKKPDDLVMSNIPPIESSPTETGITNEMLTKSEKFKSRWEGAKRFSLGVKSFITSLRNLGIVSSSEKIEDQINEVLEILYKPVKDVRRKIDGGFLVDMGNSDRSRRLKEIIPEYAKEKNLDDEQKGIAVNTMKKVVDETLKHFDSWSIWNKLCDLWNYIKEKFGKK